MFSIPQSLIFLEKKKLLRKEIRKKSLQSPSWEKKIIILTLKKSLSHFFKQTSLYYHVFFLKSENFIIEKMSQHANPPPFQFHNLLHNFQFQLQLTISLF